MIRIFLPVLFVLTTTVVAGEVHVTEEQRQAIIEHAVWLRGGGRGSVASSLADAHKHLEDRPICGTPIAADYSILRHSAPAGQGVDSLGPRPSYLPDSYASPGGRFRIHYTTTDSDAVFQPTVITNPAGVPNYVYNMALIADSVYDRMITDMGYPVPPADDGYPEGGDDRYDIYLINLSPSFLGATYPDSIDYEGDSTQATSFIVLDNDYSSIARYRDNPLPIVRVTLAHEYFHAVQFGMDWREADFVPFGNQLLFARAWMEMSAVWMEEIMYDNINDYYGYLPEFFNQPGKSIEQFNSLTDLHPYASAVWPIFLTEYFNNPDMIREIWLRCGELGYGNDFLEASQQVIDSISGGTEDWASVFREFALWNYFTGTRSSFGPNNVGYVERAQYPEIPDSQIGTHGFDSLTYLLPYPAVRNFSDDDYLAEHNATSYIRFEQTRRFTDRYWLYGDGCGSLTDDCIGFVVWDTCGDTLVPGLPALEPCYLQAVADTCGDSLFAAACIDSGFTTDSTLSWDRRDSSWNIFLAYRGNGNNRPWGMNIAYRYDDIPDSFTVDRIMLPVFTNANAASLSSDNPERFRSILMTLSQASDFRLYSPGVLAEYGYRVRESASPLDPSRLNVPGAVLYPYPNPAVLAEMTDPMLTFLFQMPTDENGSPILVRDSIGPNNIVIRNPQLVVDIFTIAGEYVTTIEQVPELIDELGEYRIRWDMKNQSGREVSSGAYIAYARMFESFRRNELLAEAKVKVAIIR